MANYPCMPNYLPITLKRRDGFMSLDWGYLI